MDNTKLFQRLWKHYTENAPYVARIHQLFTKAGETVINDHIAFRTCNDPRVTINKLSPVFIEAGYREKKSYAFPIKHLVAKHYEHKDDINAPKLFISELRLEAFSADVQSILEACIDSVPVSQLASNELIFAGNCWKPISFATYKTLLTESEYAAWLYVFGFCANHFTVNVNALKQFKEISDVNTFLEKAGFALNKQGGAVKGTPAEYLEQSSTLAEEVEIDFLEGRRKVPSCYYEFAKRYPLPNGELYQGFVPDSADKLFESTDVKKSR